MGMKMTSARIFLILAFLVFSAPALCETEGKLRALLIDGQMNKSHNMALMNEAIITALAETGLFTVTVISTPPAGEDISNFAPDFSYSDVVVLNYDGDEWPAGTEQAFEDYIRGGGGLVTVHSSDNAFPGWQAFNDMIGVGGWGGRDENWGPAVFWGENGMELDHSPGRAYHPSKHEFPVTIRDDRHPVTSGLSETWLHAKDELYSCLRGPAKNLGILATGFADPALEKASGKHEPVLMALSYGKGRIFHTTLGHIGKKETELPGSVRCDGFITTLQRGAEWAATGQVTQAVPGRFPGPDSVSTRP
jgi:type 1 glutamine amidotransferase